MSRLELTELTKRFEDDSIIAVDDLSLTVQDGEFLVIVGPSGCGKSTTLDCIAGLETPTSGDIIVDGESKVGIRPQDRDVAMVFQNYSLYPHMSVRENLGFGLEMSSSKTDDEIATDVESVADLLQISDLLNQMPNELSGGQKQRVALGRAIIREPNLFLMDEPLSNLDAKLRDSMRTEIQQLQKKMGVTTVYVTHNQTEAMTMGDRIAVMKDGDLQQTAPPDDIYSSPANKFVAEFIGSPSMNFFDVELVQTMNGVELHHPAFQFSVDDIEVEEDTASDVLTAGVRPESFSLATENSDETLTTVVSVAEPLGDRTHIHFELAGQTYSASIVSDANVAEGQKVNLTIKKNNIHLFDPESGEAIDPVGRKESSVSSMV